MKAQASLEFITFIIIILIIASVVVSSWWPIRNAEVQKRAEFAAQDTLREVVFQINTAQRIGDGYMAKFSLAQTLLGADYNITVEKHFVVLNWSSRTIIFPVLAENMTGNFQKGLNTIKNVQGEIHVN